MDGTMRSVEKNLDILGRDCRSRAVELRVRGLGRWEGSVRAQGTIYVAYSRLHLHSKGRQLLE